MLTELQSKFYESCLSIFCLIYSFVWRGGQAAPPCGGPWWSVYNVLHLRGVLVVVRCFPGFKQFVGPIDVTI